MPSGEVQLILSSTACFLYMLINMRQNLFAGNFQAKRSPFYPFWRFMLLFLPLVSGCVALQHQAAVRTIFTEPVADSQNIAANSFNLLGRISIQNKQQRYSGNFRWRHTDSNDEILLFSPVGQTVAEIWQDQHGAHLITSKQEIFHAADMENLTEEILGWRLPLNGLQYWIQGNHSPVTRAAKDINHEGRVVAIRQDNWHVFYSRFFPNKPEQIAYPRVLELNYQEMKIRMVVDNWESE